MSLKDSIAFEVITPVILLAGLTGNLFICCLIITNKKLRTSFNYLLLNLAISDMLCLLFGTLFYAEQIHIRYFSTGKFSPTDFEGIVCKVTLVGIHFTTQSSVLTLAAISKDRFYAIVHPWKHRRASKKKNTRILIAVVWLVGAITSLPMMLLVMKIPNKFQGKSFLIYLTFLLETETHSFKIKVIAFINLIATYIIPMAIILRSSLALIKHLWCHCSQQEGEQILLKTRKRITRILLSVIVAFNVFWLPWAVVEGSLLMGAVREIKDKSLIIMLSLVWSSASVNPILYSLQSRSFRKMVGKMLRCHSG